MAKLEEPKKAAASSLAAKKKKASGGEEKEVSASDVSDAAEDSDEEEEVLEIPVRDENGVESDEVISIPLSNLPKADDLLGVLKAERAALHRWLSFAVEYLRQGRLDEFEEILEQGCSKEVEHFYESDRDGRLKMLNAYAAYKISLDKGFGSRGAETHLAEAVELINRADNIDDRSSATWVNKGVLSLVRGDMDNALQNFDSALQSDPRNLLAKLGKGVMLFKKRQFKEARDQFKRAIRDHPGCGANVRVNLGLCYYELGMMNRAVECFERAIDIDDEEVNAHVALAVIELGRAQQENFNLKLSQSAMQRLRKAYELQPTDSMVLNHMANHFFFRKSQNDRDYSRIESLARKAYKNTHIDPVKAESAYILGRNFHEQGDMDAANQFYERALEHWSNFTLAQFARAQMLLAQSERLGGGSTKDPEREKARKKAEHLRQKGLALLEKILKDNNYKNDRDTNLFASWLHIRMNRRAPAMTLLRQVSQENPDDTEAWLEQARVLQKEKSLTKKQRKEALRAYTKAAAGLDPVPAFIYTNVGELKFSLGDVRGALQTFRAGLEDASGKDKGNSSGEPSSSLSAEDSVTLRFNLARVLEEVGEFDEAESIYKKLHEELPLYSEPLLRLGQMAERHGHNAEAAGFYTKAANETKTNPDDAWVFLGLLAKKTNEPRKAKEYFGKVFKGDKSRIDAYSRLSLANNAFESLRRLKKVKPEEFTQNLDYAKKAYIQVLERSSGNIYAANGLANTLAMQDHIKEAKQIYERLREPDDAANPSVWVNLGHVAMEEQKYDTAVSLYQQCIKRFGLQQNVDLLTYLANALLCAGKYDEAKSTLLRATHVDPSDLRLRYNLATLLLQQGLFVCEKAENRTLQSVLKAVQGFNDAKNIFEWLAHCTPKDAAAAGGAGKESLTTKTADKSRRLQEPSSPKGTPSADNKKYFELIKKAQQDAKNGIVSASSSSSQDQGPQVDSENQSRRPLSRRAPKSDAFKHTAAARKLLNDSQKLLTESKKYIATEQHKESMAKDQLQKLQSESQRIESELEAKRKEQEEEQKQAQLLKEEKARQLMQRSLELAESFARTVQEKKQKKAAKEDKKGGRKKGGRKGKRPEDDLVVDDDDEDALQEVSSEDSDGDDNEEEGDGEFDPKEAARKEREKEKKLNAANGKGDSEEEEEDVDELFEDSSDEDENGKAKLNKSKKGKRAAGDDAEGKKPAKKKRKLTKKAASSDSSDDEEEEAKPAQDKTDADKQAETTDAPAAKKKVMDSDDEEEMEF